MTGKTKLVIGMGGLALVGVFALAGFVGCTALGGEGPPTTNTSSESFKTLAEKVAFFRKYVGGVLVIEELDFHIRYDNNTSIIPAPSDSNFRAIARVPATDIAKWIEGHDPVDAPDAQFEDISWIKTLPGTVTRTGPFKWYNKGLRYVGVDEANSIIVYWYWKF
ncbi:MAG: hypothetical protein HN909_05295 [Phycisphaerales bacterium]|jgi:hypothetical protein|nr:hypothetical protein [Phycisphaerales bacterium]MBT7171168.1 hypothetical protein [Phycisphaerales bacterium]